MLPSQTNSSGTPCHSACVVGGGAGGRLSLKALAQSPHFLLKACADLREETCSELRQMYPGLQTYSSYEAMFKDCPTDVICVSTWPASHEEVVDSALKNDALKGMLVEKPLGHDAASGNRILEAIMGRGLPMAVPHGLLANETPLDIIRRVHAGDIGQLKLVEIQCCGWDIINAGIHWVHFFVSLLQNDAPAWVMAQCDSSSRTYRDGMQVETHAVTYVQTQAGVRLVMETGDHVQTSRAGKETLFRLVGTHGQIEFWGWERGYLLQNIEHPEPVAISVDALPVRGHRLHLENMARQIDSGQPCYELAKNSLTALQICEGAYLSNRLHARVTLPLEDFTAAPAPAWDPGMPYAGVGGGRNGRTA